MGPPRPQGTGGEPAAAPASCLWRGCKRAQRGPGQKPVPPFFKLQARGFKVTRALVSTRVCWLWKNPQKPLILNDCHHQPREL